MHCVSTLLSGMPLLPLIDPWGYSERGLADDRVTLIVAAAYVVAIGICKSLSCLITFS